MPPYLEAGLLLPTQVVSQSVGKTVGLTVMAHNRGSQPWLHLEACETLQNTQSCAPHPKDVTSLGVTQEPVVLKALQVIQMCSQI